jgi:hypothetical protein
MGANDKPSARQLRYLRALIDATGQTCTWPGTRREASRAIAQLKRAPTASRTDAVADELNDRPRKRLDYYKPIERNADLLLQ